MTINTESVGSAVRRIGISTRLDMSPCEVTVETVEATASAAVGDALTVDGISATITSVEKRWHSKLSSSSQMYYITYRAQNEPRLWAEEYSYHFFEYYGKTVNEIISEVNENIGSWSISSVAETYYLRQYDNDSSLTNIIKDLADMVGKIPVLNHKTKTITFQDITTYAGTITEHDFSTEDEDLIDYTYIDEEEEETGTIVNGVYNAPFYNAVQELFLSVQQTAWSVEMLDTSESDDELPQTYAEIIANTSVDYENFEFDTISSGSSYSHFVYSLYGNVGTTFPEELTEMDYSDAGTNTGLEVFVQTGDDLHTLDIQVHFMVHVNTSASSEYFNTAAEKAARSFLSFLRLYITANVQMTGEFFEVTNGSGDLNTMHTYYIVPVSEGSNSSDVPQKLADRIHWYKTNKKRVNATVAGMYYAGDTFEGGRVYSSNIEWSRDTQEWRSNIEVIGGSSS